jgi:DNA-binding LacI/PurR family transcriptional regulator
MTENDVRRVAEEALVSVRTVWNWMRDPGSINENNRLRIERAIKKLKVQVAKCQK